MDLQALMRDRRVQIGAVGAVALVGFVVARRRSPAGGSASGAGTVTQAGGPAQFDSSGADLASWMGQYDSQTANLLAQYQSQLTGLINGLHPTDGPARVPSRPPSIGPAVMPNRVPVTNPTVNGSGPTRWGGLGR